MRQIKESDHAEPFRTSGRRIVLIGANFNGEIRNIDEWVAEGKKTENAPDSFSRGIRGGRNYCFILKLYTTFPSLLMYAP